MTPETTIGKSYVVDNQQLTMLLFRGMKEIQNQNWTLDDVLNSGSSTQNSPVGGYNNNSKVLHVKRGHYATLRVLIDDRHVNKHQESAEKSAVLRTVPRVEVKGLVNLGTETQPQLGLARSADGTTKNFVTLNNEQVAWKSYAPNVNKLRKLKWNLFSIWRKNGGKGAKPFGFTNIVDKTKIAVWVEVLASSDTSLVGKRCVWFAGREADSLVSSFAVDNLKRCVTGGVAIRVENVAPQSAQYSNYTATFVEAPKAFEFNKETDVMPPVTTVVEDDTETIDTVTKIITDGNKLINAGFAGDIWAVNATGVVVPITTEKVQPVQIQLEVE